MIYFHKIKIKEKRTCNPKMYLSISILMSYIYSHLYMESKCTTLFHYDPEYCNNVPETSLAHVSVACSLQTFHCLQFNAQFIVDRFLASQFVARSMVNILL